MSDTRENGHRDNDLRDVAAVVLPDIEPDVDSETGLVVYKYRLLPERRAFLLKRAREEGITLKELIDRAIGVYLALDISGQEPGTYYERHTPGKPTRELAFPFWPFRRRSEQE